MPFKDNFVAHPQRHPGISYDDIKDLIDPATLAYLEDPDVLAYQGHLYLVDFSHESPSRRSVCYDKEARVQRKKNPPITSAMEEAQKHGLSLVDEDMYMYMQSLAPLDEKSQSWIATPSSIRELGGALFGSYKYGRAFIFYNGADAYYATRGFRCCLLIK